MSKEYLGARLTKSEHSFLEDLANRNGSTKTDALRKLIAGAMNGSKSDERLLEQFVNHMGVIMTQNKSLREEGRYTSLLLTSLVQKVAKDNPTEGKKMIDEAFEKARRTTT